MTLRARIASVFGSGLVLVLSLFGTYVYFSSSQLRSMEFYERLRERAQLAGQMVLQADELPPEQRLALQAQFRNALPKETLLIYNEHDSIVFLGTGAVWQVPNERLRQARQQGEQRWSDGKRQFLLKEYHDRNHQFVVALAAEDHLGFDQLRNLYMTLWIGLGVTVLVTTIMVWWFAGWAIAPLRSLTQAAASITDLTQRLGHQSEAQDELARLTDAFNLLLQRLDASFQMQKAFVTNASHELRTPLAVLSAQLQQAKTRAQDPEVLRHLEDGLETIEQLVDLTHHLMLLAQSSQEAKRVPMEHLRAEELVFSALERAQRRFPTRQVQLEIDALMEMEAEPWVRGNSVLLVAALYNLLVNACKYSDAPAPVFLQVAPQQGTLLFAVRDQGRGMTPEDIAQVFDLFFRGTAAQDTEGSGVGLPLVRRIVELHAGQLRFESVPGQGTTVTVLLPLAPAPAGG